MIENIFKHAGEPGTIGDGTTLAALRNEVLTGLPTKGHFHLQVGWDSIRALDDILGNPTLSSADRAVAQDLKTQIIDALQGR